MLKNKEKRMLALAKRIKKEIKYKFEWDGYQLKCEYKTWLKSNEDDKYNELIVINEYNDKYVVHKYTDSHYTIHKQCSYIVNSEERLIQLISEEI